MTHRTSFQIFSRTDGLNTVFLNRVVDEWNGLPNHIRESNSIATFKRNVLSFIKDNQNIYISICIYFSYMLISGGIPSMAHWCFWLSPSPQLFLFCFVFFVCFCLLKQCQFISFHYLLVMQCSESVINKVVHCSRQCWLRNKQLRHVTFTFSLTQFLYLGCQRPFM